MTKSKSSRNPDATSWFGPILDKLRAEYGDDVQVGTPIDIDYLDLLEKQLRVKFPADYRAFLASYGFLRVRETIIYGVPMSTTRDANAVDLRRGVTAFARLVEVRSDLDDLDFVNWYVKSGTVAPVIGELAAFDEDAYGHVRGEVYAIDARGKLWDLGEVIPEPSEHKFRELVETLASRLGDQRRKPPDEEEPDDPTPYRRLIPVSAALARSIEEQPQLADDVALQRRNRDSVEPPSAANVVELRRHIPALLEVLAPGAPIARAMCGDHDLRGPEMQTRMFTPSEVSELAAALTNVVEAVRAAGPRRDLEAVIDLATRVRDAYQGASQAGYAMMIRYSRI